MISLGDALTIAVIAPNIFLPWIGILRTFRDKSGRSIALFFTIICYPIITLALSMVLGSFDDLARISPSILEVTMYAAVSYMSAIIPIFMSDRLRVSLLEPISILLKGWGQSSENLNVRTLWSEDPWIPNSHVAVRIRRGSNTIKRTTSTYVTKTVTQVRMEKPDPSMLDKDYQEYLAWRREFLGFSSETLSYGEFCRVRDLVRSEVGVRSIGSRSGLTMRALAVFARIALKNQVDNPERWRDEIRELKRLGLISKKLRLMPKGVRLSKALKREGLLRDLAWQIEW